MIMRMSDSADVAITAPFAGVVVSIARQADELVGAGAAVIVLEAMKMEHEVLAQSGGIVRSVEVAVGDSVEEGQVLVRLTHASIEDSSPDGAGELPPEAAAGRADLDEVRERHALTLDAARTDAVARRHERGRRTARENLEDLLDEGSFVEYGPLLFAAQEARRSREELIARTPGGRSRGGHRRDRR